MGYHDEPMRLASAEIGGNEVAVVLWAGGALPLAEVPDPDGWPTGLLPLLEGGRLDDLRLRWDGLSGRELEELAVRAIPAEDLTYAPRTAGRARSGA
jgi:hypothetical protein